MKCGVIAKDVIPAHEKKQKDDDNFAEKVIRCILHVGLRCADDRVGSSDRHYHTGMKKKVKRRIFSWLY